MTSTFALALLITINTLGLSFVSALQSPKTASRQTTSQSSADWPMFARDLQGSHYNPLERIITPANVKQLKPKWAFETGGDVSSQPIVVNRVVYFGSWDGKEYAVDATTGSKIWEFDLKAPSRSGAALANGVLYFGALDGQLYALEASTGRLIWKIKIDPHETAIATSSPIFYNGRIYIGISSREENSLIENPAYKCCSFRGGVAAFDARQGKQVWRFYTIPEPATDRGKDKKGRSVLGPSGNAVWSTVAVHPESRRLYFTTGNQYTDPETEFTDAIIALDLDTGKLIWTYQSRPADRFTSDCDRSTGECGPDFDFGTMPLAFNGPGGKRLIGAGCKNGTFYALDAKDGKLAWKTDVAKDRFAGSIVFGNSTDGERLYFAISNAYRKNKQGSVGALDASTGEILWQTLSPDGYSNHGPITVTGVGENRLLFAGSTGNFIRAYNAKTGEILWEFDTGGGIAGGPTVVDGVVYVGSGFRLAGAGKGNNRLFAFSIDGK